MGKKKQVKVLYTYQALFVVTNRRLGNMRAEEWSKEQEVGGFKVSSSMGGKDRNDKQRWLIRQKLQQWTLLMSEW